MVNFEITKIQKIQEVNNSMCHNFYYLYYGRIYNEKHTKYKKFKYVLWFDVFDVMEYFEKDTFSDKDVKTYASELENNYIYNIKNYEDTEGLKEFYNYCNKTIQDYNNTLCY